MKTDYKYTNYTHFLKDRQFLQWQFAPNEELNDYWNDFFSQYPELKETAQKAIIFLKNKGMNKSNLSHIEQVELLERIQLTIKNLRKRKMRKLLFYIPISAAAILLIILAINLFSSSQKEADVISNELIIGEVLNTLDIQLITSDKSIMFQNDVELTLNEDGVADIVEGDNTTSKIKIAGAKLNSLIVPYGKRSRLTLADGSKVWLNSGSVLEFPSQFSDNKREIKLTSGEMYVNVVQDNEKPFHVNTGNINVKVYGTSFNISNYSDTEQSVILVEGKISLQLSDKNEELFLQPNEQAIYNQSDQLFEKREIDVSQHISWKYGYLLFDKTPMTEVLQNIGRYYNLSFNFDNDINLQNRTCTGKIHLSENLDNVMSIIGILTSTTYTRDDNKIVITNNPT